MANRMARSRMPFARNGIEIGEGAEFQVSGKSMREQQRMRSSAFRSADTVAKFSSARIFLP